MTINLYDAPEFSVDTPSALDCDAEAATRVETGEGAVMTCGVHEREVVAAAWSEGLAPTIHTDGVAGRHCGDRIPEGRVLAL